MKNELKKSLQEVIVSNKKVYSNYDRYMYTVHNLSLGRLEYEGNVYDLDNQRNRQRLLDLLVKVNILQESEIYNGHYLDIQYRFKEEYLTPEFIKENLHNLLLQEKSTVLTFRKLLESIDSNNKVL